LKILKFEKNGGRCLDSIVENGGMMELSLNLERFRYFKMVRSILELGILTPKNNMDTG